MPSRTLRVAASLLPLLLMFPANGQQLLKPQSISFDGLKDFSPDELLRVAGVVRGQIYTGDFLNQSAQKLMATGVFQKVGFKFDGVTLTYLITENPELYPAVIDNLPLETGEALEARLRQQLPLYHGKVPSEGTVLDDVKSALQSMLSEEGIDAKVTSTLAGDNPNKKVTSIKFRIDAPAVELGDVQLSGVSDPLLQKMAETVKHASPAFSATQSAKRLEDQIAEAYRLNGYPLASVQAHPAGKPVLVSGVIRVPFAVSVKEGHAYKLGKVQLSPDAPVTFAEVEKSVLNREHFVPESFYLGAVVMAVDTRLKGKGYLDCTVTPRAQIDEPAGVVNYSIDAVTGPQYHLALFKFDNVSDSLRSLLMRSWQMMPGDPFDESYVANFILIAQKSDPVLQRSLAGVKATYDVHADSDSHEVNLVIHLSRQ